MSRGMVASRRYRCSSTRLITANGTQAKKHQRQPSPGVSTMRKSYRERRISNTSRRKERRVDVTDCGDRSVTPNVAAMVEANSSGRSSAGTGPTAAGSNDQADRSRKKNVRQD